MAFSSLSSRPNVLFFAESIETVLKFPPLFRYVKSQARQKIVERGSTIGIDWKHERNALSAAADWLTHVDQVQDKNVVYPEYYKKPFHGYDQASKESGEMGNLCLEAALEVELASDCVHANVMDPDKKQLAKEGDWDLRRSYHRSVHELLQNLGNVRLDRKCRILDVGCSTGRSSQALLQAFPQSEVTGIDLSPYFLAVGKYLHDQRLISGKSENLTFVHGAMEENPFPDKSFELVSICLVFHELPQAAIQQVLQSAWRVLVPGGIITIMEMDPLAPNFTKIFSNPFALAGFKSTEPWLLEYVSCSLEQEVQAKGFTNVTVKNNSPGHKTIIGIKS